MVVTPTPVPPMQIAVLGDLLSIGSAEGSAEETWWALLAGALSQDASSVTVSAMANTAFCLADGAEEAPWQDSRIAALAERGTPDLILVLAGTLDAAFGEAGQVRPGEDEEALLAGEPSTARGASLTFLRLQQAYPEARIVVLIPPEMPIDEQMDGLTLQRFNWACNAIADAARATGVALLDLRDSSIQPDRSALFAGDGLSLGAAGMRALADWLALALPLAR